MKERRNGKKRKRKCKEREREDWNERGKKMVKFKY
jgi:hypothetical protein